MAPALALWGHPGSGSADAGIPPLGQDTTSIMATAVRSRWPRIPRAAPRGGLVAGFRVARLLRPDAAAGKSGPLPRRFGLKSRTLQIGQIGGGRSSRTKTNHASDQARKKSYSSRIRSIVVDCGRLLQAPTDS